MLLLKRSIKIILKTLLGFVVFILLYLLFAWLLPKIKLNSDYKPAQQGIEVFVSSNGVHTDFVVPTNTPLKDWRNDFLPNTFESVDTTYEYVSLGWGDKGFFLNTPTWADLKFSTAFKAAFFMSSTAMHVTYKKHKPKEGASCKKLLLTEAEYKKLIAYVYSSFQLKDNTVQLINHPGYNEFDNFYEANGTYSFLKTCNVWTGQGLNEIGAKVGCWTPFESALMNN
jgi:uncharacterized protein (TIGR02117 family)